MAKKVITLNELYDIMYDHLNPNGWWPGRNNWEIIWGTVLIQNTNWKNAKKALDNLYSVTNFLPRNILNVSDEKLAETISSAGFYTRKAQTIKNLANYFKKFDFNLERIQSLNSNNLRKELLSINGIGSETADVILLYGLGKSEFVMDKYAYRLFNCLGWDNLPSYESAKLLIESQINDFTPKSYQNFHALIDMFNQQYKLPRDFDQTFLTSYHLNTIKKDNGSQK